jgi:hypothetical protein
VPRADPRGERADAPARGNQGGAAPAHRRLQERPPPSGRAGARRRQLEEAGRRLPPKTAVAAPRRRAAEADRQQNAADDPGQARPEAAAAAAGHAGHQGAKRQRGALLRVAAEEVVRPNGLEYRLNGGGFRLQPSSEEKPVAAMLMAFARGCGALLEMVQAPESPCTSDGYHSEPEADNDRG